MQSQTQSQVKCKYCKKSLYTNQMYAHFQECNKQNHPNYKSEIQSDLKQNRSRVQQSNIPQQQIKTSYNSSKQPVQYVESNIYPQQQDIDYNVSGRRINYAQQNNYQEKQKKIQQNRNAYTEELLQRAQKKCEYCDQEYPTQMLNQHYPQCEAKRMTQQEQLLIQNQHEFNSFDSRNQSNVHHPRNNQSRINNNISYYQPQNRDSNISIDEQDESISVEGIANLINNLDLTGEIPSPQRENYQRPYQQQNSHLQPFNNLFRSYIQTSQFNNIFDLLVNGSLFGNFRGMRFFMSPLTQNQYHNRNHQFQNNSTQGLENLAVIKYTAHQGLSSEYKQCIICVSNYEDGEELILLPCIHRFHKNCISEWFKQQSTCPICKTDVTKQEMAFEEDDQI